MDKKLYNSLSMLGGKKEYAKGEKIVSRSTRINHVFLLITGNCFVDYNDANGNEIIVNEFLDSVIFGAIEVISGQNDYMANVTTLKKSQFIVINKEDFLKELTFNHVFTSLILKNIARLSIEVMAQIRMFKLKSDYIRLIVFLLKRADKAPVVIEDKKEFMANLLSINERTLYRYIKKLEAEHAIVRSGQNIVIGKGNKKKLKKLL